MIIRITCQYLCQGVQDLEADQSALLGEGRDRQLPHEGPLDGNCTLEVDFRCLAILARTQQSQAALQATLQARPVSNATFSISRLKELPKGEALRML